MKRGFAASAISRRHRLLARGRHGRVIVGGILNLLALSSPAFAQNACTALLAGGIFDRSVIQDDQARSSVLSTLFCRAASSSSNNSTTLGLDVPQTVGFNFGTVRGSSSSENVCDGRNLSQQALRHFSEWTAKASPAIVNAFNQCINANGVQIYAERTLDPAIFRLTASTKFQLGHKVAPVHMSFGFQPYGAILSCSPVNVQGLSTKFALSNFSAISTVCTLARPSHGVQIGITAEDFIPPLNSLSIDPLLVLPIFLNARETSLLDGVGIVTASPVTAYIDPAGEALGDSYDANGKFIPPSMGRTGRAEWNIRTPVAGRYRLFISYAAAEPRPINVLVNGVRQLSAMGGITGGWGVQNRRTDDFGSLILPAGNSKITFVGTTSFPHFHEARLVFESE